MKAIKKNENELVTLKRNKQICGKGKMMKKMAKERWNILKKISECIKKI